MRKHLFAKIDCNCLRKATYLKCKFCGTVEYRSIREVRRLNKMQAECESPDAPEVEPKEAFKGMLGGTFDCLAPDYDTFFKGQTEEQCENC